MPSLREALTAAYEGDQSPDDVPEAIKRPEEEETAETPNDTSQQASEPEAQGASPEPAEEEAKATESQEPQEEPGAAPEPPEPPVERVPSSWRAAARQEWEKAPSAVRQEVIKREREIDSALRESAEAKRFQQQFQETVQPYQTYITAAGTDPLTATRNLMQTAAALQVGNPHQKAQIIANLIQTYQVDIPTLDNTLVGEAPSNGAGNGQGGYSPQIAQMIQQELAPVREFMSGLHQAQQSRQEQQAQTVEEEINTFADDPQNVFFEDVRETMATLLEVSGNQGQQMSLKEAYDMAVAMNPELSKLSAQRQVATQAPVTQQALERKKRAASSVQGVPQPQESVTPTDMHAQLSAAWDKYSGGSA